jgi:glycosyltransferase involved in cell wall biosynthesis
VPARDIVVTVNGIDTDKFSPDVPADRVRREFGLDGSGPVIVHVSRLDKNTSIVARQLIVLAPELAAELPGLRLVIAGGGDDYEELLEAAQRANYETNRRTVVMAGPRTDIAEIVSAGDLFVGVSRAALEAMAAASPSSSRARRAFSGSSRVQPRGGDRE